MGHLADDPTTVWARDAVNGRIVVGEIVAAAAERHLDDGETETVQAEASFAPPI
jgi:hypothetical protein